MLWLSGCAAVPRRCLRALALSAALAAGSLLAGGSAAGRSLAELEAQVDAALEATEAALALDEARMDEMAARNRDHKLTDGSPSLAQATANIRLWERHIRELGAGERELREELKRVLASLGPNIAELVRRVSAQLPAVPAARSLAELEQRMNEDMAAAEAALAAEEARLDDLAVQNSRRTLAGGTPSSAQAAANIRRWDHRIRELEAHERQLREHLGSMLDALGPDLAALSRRLSSPDPIREPPRTVDIGSEEDDPGADPEPDQSTAAVALEQPLQRDGSELFRRVLSLPGAGLQREPGGETPAEDIRTFSVYYVYEERELDEVTWLRVGQSVQGGPEGWIATRDAEEWRNMLVMQFPDRVNRKRVLFFERNQDLRRLLSSFGRERLVEELYDTLRRDDPDTDRLVAAEPAESIAKDERPYLMPILDWRSNVTFADTGDITTLVQVAGLNAGDGEAPAGAGESGEPTMSDLNLGIAIVIDTTRSMWPYIQAAREIVGEFAEEMEREGLDRFVDFALVGYRDNTTSNADIGYVSRIYRDFESTRSVEALKLDLAKVQISRVSTQDWREDAFAGLRTAIEHLSWSPGMEARVIMLITDAGARSGSDPLASTPDYDVLNVLSDAERANIAIVPIHLMTPEARQYDDVAHARSQYQGISATAEGFNYIAMPLDDEQVYRMEMRAMVRNLRRQIERLSRNERIESVEEDRILSATARAMLESFAVDDAPLGEDEDTPGLAARIQNQLFRAQLDYLGRKQGTALPPFYRAWAADLDISNPRYQALDVRVFLTRNQLNELAEVLHLLLDEARRAEKTPEGMMQSLWRISASVSVDPNLRTRVAQGEGEVDDLLPAFLRELPYRSNIFNLSLRDFANASIQLEVLEGLDSKLQQYRRINGDTVGWLDLGSGDPGEFVYPIELRLLP